MLSIAPLPARPKCLRLCVAIWYAYAGHALMIRNLPMLFARIILSIQIVALTALGLAYFIRPEEMASFSGALLMGNAAVTEVRAYYGGLQLGLAAYLAMALLCCGGVCVGRPWCRWQTSLRPARWRWKRAAGRITSGTCSPRAVRRQTDVA